MSDISKCADSFCPSKDHCYRFNAPASLVWQSFNDFQRKGRPCCDSYIPELARGTSQFQNTGGDNE